MSEPTPGALGAIDWTWCPTRTVKRLLCRCEFCAVCGCRKHSSLHDRPHGHSIDAAPYDHAFQPREHELSLVAYPRVCAYVRRNA